MYRKGGQRQGFWDGPWYHEAPGPVYEGKQVLVRHLRVGPLETWSWYWWADGRFSREVCFIEGPQAGEQYEEMIGQSGMLAVLDREIALCHQYGETDTAALLQEVREYIVGRTPCD